MKKKIVCPHCGKSNTWREDNPYRPFCSERCRLIDLGSWAKEDYKISSEETDDQVSQNDEDTDK